MDEAPERATTERKQRSALRVANALTRTKLRQVEKRLVVLMNALSNIATSDLPKGFTPTDRSLPCDDEPSTEEQMLEAIQDYALFILNAGAGVPDRLAVVGYAQGTDVFCMDCARRGKGSMEPVLSGVDLIACAGCAAGLFVE